MILFEPYSEGENILTFRNSSTADADIFLGENKYERY